MQLAIRTRGYQTDYDWTDNYGGHRHQPMGEAIADDKPGILIQKNNGIFDILAVGIEREGQKDFRGRQIAMQLFIGGVDEPAARGIAAAVLQDWKTAVVFASAVKVQDTSQETPEWIADWEKMESLVKRIPPADTNVPVLSDAWEDDYSLEKKNLLQDLLCYRFSVTDGYKLYWGGVPNSEYWTTQLRKEVDRFYWDGAERIDLTQQRQEEQRRLNEEKEKKYQQKAEEEQKRQNEEKHQREEAEKREAEFTLPPPETTRVPHKTIHSFAREIGLWVNRCLKYFGVNDVKH